MNQTNPIMLLIAGALLAPWPAIAQAPIDRSESRVAPVIERYRTDTEGAERFFNLPFSDAGPAIAAEIEKRAAADLNTPPFASLTQEERVDYLLLRRYMAHRDDLAARQRKAREEIAPALPFAQEITELEERRRHEEPLDAQQSAATLSGIEKQIKDIRPRINAKGAGGITLTRVQANRAAGMVERLKDALSEWYRGYDGYSPDFNWWCAKPYQAADAALSDYGKYLREQIAGVKPGDDTVLLGDPIGRDAILQDLRSEMIPYAPEDLIKIAETEFAWCEQQMKIQSRAMGKGDDWKAALEAVKADHAPPGKQDELIAADVKDILAFVDSHDLVTIDPLCRQTWDVRMLSPAEQKYLPFAAYGGQSILVAYPTDQMDYDARIQDMRANNIHFTHNVVPHELMPGHHLQGYMAERYRPYRQMFSTPFLVEGWALYWEMFLYDTGWPRGPEDRIGMLFWRMHRCARIIVSLKFHLGEMTPQQMIDYLVDRVGHERDAATSEVRRFIGGGYSPLYQVAYMIGGLQLRALHHELVDSRKMSNRQFHDSVLKEGPIPIEMIRAALEKTPLTEDYAPRWKFAETRSGQQE